MNPHCSRLLEVHKPYSICSSMTEKTATDGLTTTIPIFPLEGVLLLPGGDLPLNIFEPRYLAMTKAALAGDRLIGIIQPCPCSEKMAPGARPYYEIGCVGRISSLEETPDGRLLINLHGISRFHLVGHKLNEDGYRMAHVNFEGFENDQRELENLPECLTRCELIDKLKEYLTREGLYLDWDLADQVPDHRFYTLLAMVCPFSPAEKQALLEAPDMKERCRMLKSLLELACAETQNASRDLPC